MYFNSSHCSEQKENPRTDCWDVHVLAVEGLQALKRLLGFWRVFNHCWVLLQHYTQRDRWVGVLAKQGDSKKEGKLTFLCTWKVHTCCITQIALNLLYIIGSCFWVEFFWLSYYFSTFVYRLWSYTVHAHQLIKLSRFQNKSLSISAEEANCLERIWDLILVIQRSAVSGEKFLQLWSNSCKCDFVLGETRASEV